MPYKHKHQTSRYAHLIVTEKSIHAE